MSLYHQQDDASLEITRRGGKQLISKAGWGRIRSVSRRNFSQQLEPYLRLIETDLESLTDPKQRNFVMSVRMRIAAIRNAPSYAWQEKNLLALEKLWGLHSEKKVLEIHRDDSQVQKTKEEILEELIQAGVIERKTL